LLSSNTIPPSEERYFATSHQACIETMAKKQPALKKSRREAPVILVTNDDGFMAPGIRNLVEAVKDLGKVPVGHGPCHHHRLPLTLAYCKNL